MTRAKRLAIRLPAAAAPATEAPRAASQRYPITVNAHVTAQIPASVVPSAGFGAVGRFDAPTARGEQAGGRHNFGSGGHGSEEYITAPMEVQVFGVRKSADTRAALRFFAERRIKVHFVDLNERAAAVGELRRFAQKFGVAALIDRNARRLDRKSTRLNSSHLVIS